METDPEVLYEQLAQYLGRQPGGYPRTESGVELRILRRLFTPQQAGLALHLTIIPEEVRVVAYRAGLPLETTARLLEEMEQQGLIFGLQTPGKAPEYAIQQFVIGFWEGQVNRLNRELVEDFEEYLPVYYDPQLWGKAPQLRTIPVRESIPVPYDILAYESVENLIRAQKIIAVSNCICRQEQRLLGQGCDKPEETCFSFGAAAEAYVRIGRARAIAVETALEILRQAEQAGLVLQPGNAREPLSLCACCGCCCGVLRSLKRHPQPARLTASPFQARLDEVLCAACGECVERCPMQALTLEAGPVRLDLERCLGCGLCVGTCATGALSLVRKPPEQQPFLPKDTFQTYLQMGQARGVLGRRELVTLLAHSKEDRRQASETVI